MVGVLLALILTSLLVRYLGQAAGGQVLPEAVIGLTGNRRFYEGSGEEEERQPTVADLLSRVETPR